MTGTVETLGFQAEVKQMLHLVVHSLYSNKEIFLRELVSNASDALDKLRFLALSDGGLYENDPDLKITIVVDPEAKTLTITDNGIGMTREETIDNLGTIAKSGTKAFLEALTGDKAKDSQLIGQFGVGFYSSFMVADKVVVRTRKAGLDKSQGVFWESKGDGEFSITQEDREIRGTEITLHLKAEEVDFATDWRIRALVTKYSDHIGWPIVMKALKTPEGESSAEVETVNKATALWTLSKSQITDEEYQAFYKHLSHDFENPLMWSHNRVEGKQEYVSLLYIPAHAPFDLWQQEAKHGLKLYIKRVFILEDVTQFLPRYLRFVKGVIDANDLPLNVSREILQDNKQVEAIRNACTKRVLTMLEKLSEDTEKYAKFWEVFGPVIKEGMVEDFANKDAIAKLLRFTTVQQGSPEQKTSLSEYVAHMQPDQDKIYYLTAASFNAAIHSPHLEIFKKKGIDVLLLTDKVDEWLVGYFPEFEGKKLHSISKGKIDFPEETPADENNKLESMREHIKKILGERVNEVQWTQRLTDSPACVVVGEQDMGFEMQRILQSAGHKLPEVKPIFELNPKHPFIERMNEITDDALFADWTEVLFEQAILAEGGVLDNPAGFVSRMNRLLGA
ncbi:MAG: molecular chaperone HtpG [Legionellaceae bacterium]|nr:molecular chaperone HtpG [Legionellaceae bacterium]